MRGILQIILILLTGNAVSQPVVPSGIRLENIRYPFPVSELSIKVQGEDLQMAYMDVKPKSPNGQVIVLMHGKNFSSAYWEQTAGDLSKEGYRIIIPDQIGFGKSSKPTSIQYSFQLLAQNTKALLDNLKVGKAVILGHSMGGMLATRFALMYPAMTSKLILLNPIGLEDWKTVVPYQSVDAWFQSELQQDYAKMKEYQLSFYYDNKWRSEYDKWLDINAGWTINKDYHIIAETSALTYDMIFTQPVVYEFQNLRMPTLLIIGQRDRTALGKALAPKEMQDQLGNYPKLGKEIAAKIPDSKLVALENVGHLPHIESYQKFFPALLTFLKE
jgi:pimeloyl-ACP methyl ester carboxylesterase